MLFADAMRWLALPSFMETSPLRRRCTSADKPNSNRHLPFRQSHRLSYPWMMFSMCHKPYRRPLPSDNVERLGSSTSSLPFGTMGFRYAPQDSTNGVAYVDWSGHPMSSDCSRQTPPLVSSQAYAYAPYSGAWPQDIFCYAPPWRYQ